MKVEITLENSAYALSVEEGRIHTSVGYSIKGCGGLGPCSNAQEVKEKIERMKEGLIKDGHTPVVVDKRTIQSKGSLGTWMGEQPKPKAKFDLKWRWNKEHEKKHHILTWTNHSEFGDMIGKLGYAFCCNWYNSCEDFEDHDSISVEETIKKFLEENKLDCEYEIENEYEQYFGNSDGRWDFLGRADEWYKKLIENCGFKEHRGISCHSIKDLQKLYDEAKNKTQFKIYLKKCVELHYEIDVREDTDNGDFIEEGYKPEKNAEGKENIMKIKNWMEKL